MKTQVILLNASKRLPQIALLGCLLLGAVGCDGDDGKEPAPNAGSPGSEATPGGPTAAPSSNGAPNPSSAAPLYLIATAISTAEGSTTYVKTVPSLEPSGSPVNVSDGLEFAGWADVKVVGGKAYVSSAEEPKVMRFVIDAQGALVPDGVIHFGTYGSSAAMYEQHIVSPTKAYLPAAGSWVVWNPTTLAITGTIPYPPIEVRRGDVTPHYAYDRGGVLRDKYLYIPVSWLDPDSFHIEPDSRIVVFDTETDQVAKVISAPCPFLEMGTKDEAGNLYFSSWTYQPAATVALGVARGCAVKIPAGSEELDPSWTFNIADATGGHEGSALHYIGNGQALMSVFHEEKSPFVQGTTKLSDFAFGPNWTFAILDLTTRKVTRELTDLGYHEGSYYAPVIDGRTVLLTPQPNSAGENGTTYYTLLPDGTAKRGLELPGWSTRAIRVR